MSSICNPNDEIFTEGEDYGDSFRTCQVWDSLAEMVEWARNIAKGLMIVLVKAHTSPYAVTLTCDRFGKSKSKLLTPRKRERNTKKCGCKFELHGCRMRNEFNKLTHKWVLDVMYGSHNHRLTSLHGNAFIGRMTEEEEKWVRSEGNEGKTPKTIVSGLKKKFEGNMTSMKQVENFLQKINYEDRGELTVTQWSLVFLKENGYIYYPLRDVDKKNEVEVLFFAHHESLRLLKKFPYVVIIDATYKTNRYGMPLVEIVGFTCTHKTFNIAYAFTRHEKFFNYQFIMRCLRNLFEELGVMPTAIMTDCDTALIKGIKDVFQDVSVKHLLCWVHIKNNIKAHTDKVIKDSAKADRFVNQCWTLFCSTTVETYEERLNALRRCRMKGLVRYVERQWLTPYKENIVRAWTDHTLHFCTRTTNRVEGMHRVLKDILASTRGGFNRVIVRIHRSIVFQVDQIRATMNNSLNQSPLCFNDPRFLEVGKMVFSRLICRVSDRCFVLLLAMYDRIMKEQYLEHCEDYWVRECLGLPCVHDIVKAILTKTALTPDSVHDFWKEIHWELEPLKFGCLDDDVEISFPELRLREMWAKVEDRSLSIATLWQVSELYVALEHPEHSTFMEPTEDPDIRGKGRPSGSKNKGNESPTREKSHHEHVRAELLQTEAKAKEKEKEKEKEKAKKPRRSRKQVSFDEIGDEDMPSQPVESQFEQMYVKTDVVEVDASSKLPEESMVHCGVDFGVQNIDYFWYGYIRQAQDVRSDGHCGYRSLAILKGLSEGSYPLIRSEMAAELRVNRSYWEPIRAQTREGTWDDLMLQISYVRSPCERRYWLDMPFMGLVFATLYNAAVVVLSSYSLMCLPIRPHGQIDLAPPSQIVTVALVGAKNHWIPVSLTDVAPLPPITDAWRRHCDPRILWWETLFAQRLMEFKECRRQFGENPDYYI